MSILLWAIFHFLLFILINHEASFIFCYFQSFFYILHISNTVSITLKCRIANSYLKSWMFTFFVSGLKCVLSFYIFQINGLGTIQRRTVEGWKCSNCGFVKRFVNIVLYVQDSLMSVYDARQTIRFKMHILFDHNHEIRNKSAHVFAYTPVVEIFSYLLHIYISFSCCFYLRMRWLYSEFLF